MSTPFEVILTHITEIRMGSPYNTCHLSLSGFDKVNIDSYGWQDKFAWNNDSSVLILVKYNVEGNIPGFNLVRINAETGEMRESRKIFGLVNNLSINNNGIITINKFLYNKEKSTKELCCEVIEEYSLDRI
jgi:hypothetical protein